MLNDIEMFLFNFVFLKEKCEEFIIMCISCIDDGQVIVLMIFMDLDISVFFVVGVLVKDEEYVRICKCIYDGVNLEKVDIFLINVLRLCNDSVEE